MGAVGCEPHGQMVRGDGSSERGGSNGSGGSGGSNGSDGRGEKGKTLSEFGDFDKVYYFF